MYVPRTSSPLQFKLQSMNPREVKEWKLANSNNRRTSSSSLNGAADDSGDGEVLIISGFVPKNENFRQPLDIAILKISSNLSACL